MKKFMLMVFVVAMVLCSGVALAGPLDGILDNYGLHVEDDGIITNWTPNGAVNLTDINRTKYYFDNDGRENKQGAEINVQAEAYIPCYLEMTLVGNGSTTTIQSFGPNALGVNGPHPNNYWMVFDNEIGGFVDESWNSIGHGKNAEIVPGPGKYIQACDIFKVNVYSNDHFKYEVQSAPLAPVNADVTAPESLDLLPLQMRTSVDNGAWTPTPVVFDGTAIEIARRLPCQSLMAMHQFRVPYDTNIAHGKYTGVVTFRVITE